MLYNKDKSIKLFRDKDNKYRPLSLYLGSKKISGYKYSELSGNSLLIPDTYNDDCSLTINGKSEQTQTSQSKNLLPLSVGTISKDTINATVGNDGSVRVYGTVPSTATVLILTGGLVFTTSTAAFLARRLNTIPVGTAICGSYSNAVGSPWGSNPAEPRMYIKTSDGRDYGIASGSGYQTNTVPIGKTIALVYLYMPTIGAVVDYKFFPQIEKGTAPTSYTPFVPNSPSPDYPSAISSVSNFNLVSSNMSDKTQSVNFPYTLRSLPNGICDQIVIDNVAKTARFIQRVGEIILTGNEDCYLLGSNGTQAGFNIYFNKNPYSPSLVVDHSISTHFASTNWATCYDSNGLYIGITITSIFTEADLKTWLTAQYSGANPVKIQYQLYESIETILSYETVLTYYPSTQIYTDATIQPTLDGTFRVTDTQETEAIK